MVYYYQYIKRSGVVTQKTINYNEYCESVVVLKRPLMALTTYRAVNDINDRLLMKTARRWQEVYRWRQNCLDDTVPAGSTEMCLRLSRTNTFLSNKQLRMNETHQFIAFWACFCACTLYNPCKSYLTILSVAES